MGTAKMHIDCIGKCTGLDSTKNVKPARNAYPNDFTKSLDIFEDRLCVSLGVPNENARRSSSKFGLSSVLSKIVSKPKEEEMFYDVINTDASLDDGVDESFVSATSNILDMTTNTVGTTRSTHSRRGNNSSTTPFVPASKMSSLTEKPAEEEKHAHESTTQPLYKPPTNTSPPTDTVPPSTKNEQSKMSTVLSPTKERKTDDLKKSSNENVQSPKSAPVKSSAAPKQVTPAPKSNRTEAPSSASSWSLGNWITKKLNPDATIADGGKPMEAYYDDKLGRWIFPGDDPVEIAKPLAPPPMTPIVKADKAKTPPATPDDPLSCLMAPPSRARGGPPAKSNLKRDLSGPPQFSRPPVSSNTPR